MSPSGRVLADGRATSASQLRLKEAAATSPRLLLQGIAMQQIRNSVTPGIPSPALRPRNAIVQGRFIVPGVRGAGGARQLFRDYYAWGSANTTPHVHVYNGGMHLKTAGGHRYNIVQNSTKHSQADDALRQVQGKGNKKLRQTIKRTAKSRFGVDLY
jgi:hypothetical protein